MSNTAPGAPEKIWLERNKNTNIIRGHYTDVFDESEKDRIELIEYTRSDLAASPQPVTDNDEKAMQKGMAIARNSVMAAKVELILKPQYMNSEFTWHQIRDAIMNDGNSDQPTQPVTVTDEEIEEDLEKIFKASGHSFKLSLSELKKGLIDYCKNQMRSRLATPNTVTDEEWDSKPDKDGTITIPDRLDGLFNKIGMQLRFHTFSDKNEIQTIADMVKIADDFYRSRLANTEHLEKIEQLQAEVERLKDKEIKGDRELVRLHHELTVAKSERNTLRTEAIEVITAIDHPSHRALDFIEKYGTK